MLGKVSLLLIGLIVSSANGRPNEGYCPNNGIFHPHATDCSMFYLCDNNELIPFKCPPPLQWYQAIGQCAWPEVAVCSPSASCDPSAGPPACPPHVPGGPAVHLAHQSDCTKFYVCDWGAPRPVSCPAPLHFNPNLQVCDYATSAGCLCDKLNKL